MTTAKRSIRPITHLFPHISVARISNPAVISGTCDDRFPNRSLAQGAGRSLSPEAPCECTTSLVPPTSQVGSAGDLGYFAWATPGQANNQARIQKVVVVSRSNFHYDNRSKTLQPSPRTWHDSASGAAWPRRQTLRAWQEHRPQQADTNGEHTMPSSTHATEWVSSL